MRLFARAPRGSNYEALELAGFAGGPEWLVDRAWHLSCVATWCKRCRLGLNAGGDGCDGEKVQRGYVVLCESFPFGCMRIKRAAGRFPFAEI